MCNCGCNTCETKDNALVLNENKASRTMLSEALKYHIDNNKPLNEPVCEWGSREYFDLIAEARSLYSRGILGFNNPVDLTILTETDLGHFGIFEGKKVPLDFPILEDGSYIMYVKDKIINEEKPGLWANIRAKRKRVGKSGMSKPGTKAYKSAKKAGDKINKDLDESYMSIQEVLDMEIIDENITEAKYKGKTVTLNKPMRGDSKKFKVYVNSGKKNADGTIKVKKVNFGHGGTTAKKAGQKTMKIRKSNPKARSAFRARHNCDNPGPKTMARYWSCKKW